MYILEYRWRGSQLWYKYEKKFDTIDEAAKVAHSWHSDVPHKFRVKNLNGEVVWEKG